MNWSIEFKHKKEHLEVTATGFVEGLNGMLSYTGSVMQEAMQKGYRKVLIDESLIKFVLTDDDAFKIMSHFLNNKPESLDVIYSVVYNDKNQRAVDLFSELARTVGFPCYFSLNLEDAKIKLEDG